MLILILTILLSLQNFGCDAASKDDYQHLYNVLFELYNTDLRPVKDHRYLLIIDVSFGLNAINDLDEKSQTLKTYASVRMVWQDIFLTWDENQFDGIELLIIPQKRIWKPDIIIGNSVEPQDMLGYDEFLLRIYPDGVVTWAPNMFISSSCNINIRYYPFDTQECSIQLVPASYRKDDIALNVSFDTVDLSEFSENGQWNLVSSSIKLDNSTYKDIIYVNLTLKRRRPFYVLNILLPIAILSVLGSTVFLLPTASGEKISLSITLLLAYVVFLTIVTDNMPQTSVHSSLLATYLIVLVSLSASSVILTTIVLRFYHKNSKVPVPNLYKFLVKIMGVGSRSLIKKVSVDKEECSGNNDRESTEKISWVDVSAALDYIFFIVSVFVSALATVICLVMLVNSS